MNQSTIPDNLWMHPDKVEQARRMIAVAVKLYAPCKVWALYSSGDDSAVSTHIAMATGLCTGVATIDTTIAIQQAQDHARAVAAKFGWPLRTLTPPVAYEEICAAHGMPGPGRHDLIYARLKERCIRVLRRESVRRRQDRVLLITGVRLSESDRRMGHVLPVSREGRQVWVAPIVNWSVVDKLEYQHAHGIPLNPVKRVIGISGECLCGAFAKPGEREKIAAHYPDADARLRQCEARAAANCKPCAWGERPSKANHLCQQCDRKNPESPAAA